MSEILKINSLHKHYGDQHVVKGISLTLNKGDIGCLLGPSGCGKTTLLRSIAGFETLTSGSIVIDGQEVSGRNFVAPEKRQVGMVFQDNALFPHMTVKDNVAFGLENHDASEKFNIVKNLLTTIGLKEYGQKYPHELSGGEQQRVALARALAPEPSLILLDEPFSQLDVELRESLSAEIRSILKQFSITALMVTHNQNEAFSMADFIGAMSNGIMEQWDTPHGLYHHPSTANVARFVGEGAFIPGIILENGQVECALGKLKAKASFSVGEKVKVMVRPEDIVIDNNGPFKAVVNGKQFQGSNILFTLQLENGEKVLTLMSSHVTHSPGEKICFRLEMKDVVMFHDSDHYAR